MPKTKTHSASKKRFTKNANGKIKRSKGYRRHHAWAKTAKQVRQLRGGTYLEGADALHVRKLLPY